MSQGTVSAVHIACLQMEPVIGHNARNIEHSVEMIDTAAADGANLLVLPELSNSGYVFESRAEAFSLAETVGEGPAFAAWAAAARRHNAYIVAGLAEREGERLFNSAVLMSPQGLVGTYRKNHLWANENLYFEPGNLGMPVWPTAIGRISMAICYDGWFPELFRMAAVQGADIVCIPTNWVPMPEQPDDLPVMANILAMSAAHSNSLFVAAADRVGNERGQPFLGRSLIVNHTGWPLAGPASSDAEEILHAEVDLADARRKRVLNAFNQPLRDRRTDLYDERLGTEITRGWY